MPVRVRRVQPDDRARWLELFDAYVRFYEASVPADVIEVTWQRLLSGLPGEHVGFVAEDEAAHGQVVGLAHALLHRSTWSSTHYCYLEDLYVDEQARGRGVGEALIQAVSDYAKEQHSSKLYWLTHTDNTTARRLYDRLSCHDGFIVYASSLD